MMAKRIILAGGKLMLSEAFITNMVIGVSIVVIAMMILLIFQIYKGDKDNKDNDSKS